LQAALSELHARTDGPANMIAVLAQHNKGWADDLTHLSREASSIQCAYAETVTRIMTEKIDIPPPPGPGSPGVPRRDGS
jgi:hypothetical protein